MPTLRDQAICVRHWDYSETSQTVSLFLREHGMIRGLAKGARREQGRFSGGIDLLSRGEVVAIVKADRELATITDWDLHEIYWGLRRTLDANRIGYYMADLVQQFFADSSPHVEVFDALDHSLRTIDIGDPWVRLLRFQWMILSVAGYRPQLAHPKGEGPATQVGFSPSAGSIIAAGEAAPAWRVRSRTLETLIELTAHSAAESRDSDSVNRANRLLAAYIREILRHAPPTMPCLFPDL